MFCSLYAGTFIYFSSSLALCVVSARLAFADSANGQTLALKMYTSTGESSRWERRQSHGLIIESRTRWLSPSPAAFDRPQRRLRPPPSPQCQVLPNLRRPVCLGGQSGARPGCSFLTSGASPPGAVQGAQDTGLGCPHTGTSPTPVHTAALPGGHTRRPPSPSWPLGGEGVRPAAEPGQAGRSRSPESTVLPGAGGGLSSHRVGSRLGAGHVWTEHLCEAQHSVCL